MCERDLEVADHGVAAEYGGMDLRLPPIAIPPEVNSSFDPGRSSIGLGSACSGAQNADRARRASGAHGLNITANAVEVITLPVSNVDRALRFYADQRPPLRSPREPRDR